VIRVPSPPGDDHDSVLPPPPRNDHGSVISLSWPTKPVCALNQVMRPQPWQVSRGQGQLAAVGPGRLRSAVSLWLVVAALLAMTGCSSAVGDTGAPDKGYISGDGTVTVTPVGERDAPSGFRGKTLDGADFNVADHRGDVVVVNFWASWCPPCIREAPGLQRVWHEYRSHGVQFVGIDVGDNRAAAQAHERRFGVTYPSIDDPSGRVLLAFRGTLTPAARPSTLILDGKGRVAARVLGRVDATTLRDLVHDTLAEKS
jgi:thiol-disulfide isomerase/thioredoxin